MQGEFRPASFSMSLYGEKEAKSRACVFCLTMVIEKETIKISRYVLGYFNGRILIHILCFPI